MSTFISLCTKLYEIEYDDNDSEFDFTFLPSSTN